MCPKGRGKFPNFAYSLFICLFGSFICLFIYFFANLFTYLLTYLSTYWFIYLSPRFFVSQLINLLTYPQKVKNFHVISNLPAGIGRKRSNKTVRFPTVDLKRCEKLPALMHSALCSEHSTWHRWSINSLLRSGTYLSACPREFSAAS